MLLANALPSQCVCGQLAIRLPIGQELVAESDQPGPKAQVDVRRWRGIRRMLMAGNVGFAQAFIDGDCECADLESLFAWALANESVLERCSPGSGLLRWAGRTYHSLNANTLRGSRRNIAAHYDLGNEFYETWLDEGMNYSSALYGSDPGQTVEAAQAAKLDRVVELLDLGGGDRVLEIGCGWGALAERLATGTAAHVTALTLSQRQLEFARARLAGSLAAGRADVRLQDYRQVEGTYERIASIEMLEAVGQRYWPVYFDVLRRRLAPGGIAVLQVITIRPDRFDVYLREPDFIQRYIFPGGMLPTIPILKERIAKAGLKLTSMETFGPSYARTLEEWRLRFVSAWPRLSAMGFDERFRRMWTYYLSYCEAGFRAGELDVGLYRIERAGV
jgi:cyclopropane-fatty-acyl-phospholipid synthase